MAASRQRKSPSTGSAARRTTAWRQRRTLGRRAEQLPPAESCEKLPGRSIGRRGDLDPLRMDAGLRQLGQHSLQPLAPHEGDPAVVFTPQEGRPVVAHPRGELRVGGLYDRAVARDRDHGDPFGHRRRVVHRLLRFAAHLAAPCRDRMAVGCQRDVQHPDGAEDIREKIHFLFILLCPFCSGKKDEKIEYGDILSTFSHEKVEPKVSARHLRRNRTTVLTERARKTALFRTPAPGVRTVVRFASVSGAMRIMGSY